MAGNENLPAAADALPVFFIAGPCAAVIIPAYPACRALAGLTEFAAGTAKEHRRIPELPPEPATGNPYRYESGGTGFRLMLPNRRDLQFSGPPDLNMQQ